jgi:hypothetical protein
LSTAQSNGKFREQNNREKQVTPNSEKEMIICIYEKKEVRRRNKEKKKQNEKYNKRKWHIFVLTGRFCCYFTQQDLPVKQT